LKGVSVKKIYTIVCIIAVVISILVLFSNTDRIITYETFDDNSFMVIESIEYVDENLHKDISEQYRLCWVKDTDLNSEYSDGVGLVKGYQNINENNIWLIFMECNIKELDNTSPQKINKISWKLTRSDDINLVNWRPNGSITAQESNTLMDLSNNNKIFWPYRNFELMSSGDKIISYAEDDSYYIEISLAENIGAEGYSFSAIMLVDLLEDSGELDWNWIIERH